MASVKNEKTIFPFLRLYLVFSTILITILLIAIVLCQINSSTNIEPFLNKKQYIIRCIAFAGGLFCYPFLLSAVASRLKASDANTWRFLPYWTIFAALPTWIAIQFALEPIFLNKLIICSGHRWLLPWEMMGRFTFEQAFFAVPLISIGIWLLNRKDFSTKLIQYAGRWTLIWTGGLFFVSWESPGQIIFRLFSLPGSNVFLKIAIFFAGMLLFLWSALLGLIIERIMSRWEQQQLFESSELEFGRRNILIYLFIFVILFLFYGSLFPFEYRQISFKEAWNAFWDVQRMGMIWRQSDMVTNILMFVPVGFIGMSTFASDDEQAFKIGIKFFFLISGGVLISLAMEFCQTFTSNRTPSISDIFAHIAGNIYGIGLWYLMGKNFLGKWIKFLVYSPGRRNANLHYLLIYCVIVIFYQLRPFHFTIALGQLAKKYKAGMISLLPFIDLSLSNAFTLLMDVLIYCPVGFIIGLPGAKKNLVVSKAVLLGVLFVIVIECAQIFSHSRYSSSTDVIFGAIGILIGSVLSWLFVNSFRRPTR